jgi:hypothetical protein
MWFTAPLFLAIGVTLYVAFPLYTPKGFGSQAEWAKINVGVLVGGGCALLGTIVGWFLDWLAHKK